MELAQGFQALSCRPALHGSQEGEGEPRGVVVAGADGGIGVGEAASVEEVVAEPDLAIRIQPASAAREEARENQVLRDVRLKLELEERNAASGMRALGGDQEVVQLLHEDGERLDVVVVEAALRRLGLESVDERVRV